MRPTEDVDTVVKVARSGELEELRKKLCAKGFYESPEEKVICRFKNGDLVLDVMPDEMSIYGFTNRWYTPGLENSIQVQLSAREIKVFSPVYLLATKMQAFGGRGKGSFALSHDIEDIVNLFDGRAKLVEEVRADNSEAADFIRDCLKIWTKDQNFSQAERAKFQIAFLPPAAEIL